ncbi:hypothetical protein T4B_12376 [Trichinella pseudospiralis]|uniref:Uncharacterized protein n=1 Tax=Trichinella pseudospiralis TaxID=6337 RepID=A0A0V1IX78_TRIPS|nr:hypothetical protein T4B_12376 [Trichinella pseudospiralis]
MGNSVFTVLSMITHAPDEVKLHESIKVFQLNFCNGRVSSGLLIIYPDQFLSMFTSYFEGDAIDLFYSLILIAVLLSFYISLKRNMAFLMSQNELCLYVTVVTELLLHI